MQSWSMSTIVFPVSAGVTPTTVTTAPAARGLPRKCGGDPKKKAGWEFQFMSSP